MAFVGCWILSLFAGWPVFFYLLGRKFWNPRRKPDFMGSVGLTLLCWFVTGFFLCAAPHYTSFAPTLWLWHTMGSCGVAIMIGLPYALILARVVQSGRQARPRVDPERGPRRLGVVCVVALLSQVLVWMSQNQRWPFAGD
jgi:hypothetical protein